MSPQIPATQVREQSAIVHKSTARNGYALATAAAAATTASAASAAGAAASASTADKKREPIVLYLNGQWYDLTAWAPTHPGGEDILRRMHHRDATDVFASLHSREARARLSKLPTLPAAAAPQTAEAKAAVAADPVHTSWRKLVSDLEREGYFERTLAADVFFVALCLGLYAAGIAVVDWSPLLAILLVGTGMEQAGWLGHDYSHARGAAAQMFSRTMSGLLNGFSISWWARKHNGLHHCFVNRVGVDLDIANDPVFHLWIPEDDKDHWIRRYQHLYYLPVMSAIYPSWRVQGWMYAWETRNWTEFACIVANYVWMFALLPWYVVIGSILWGGFLVGVIVTATHQSEPLLDEDRPYSFVRDQLLTSRDADIQNPVFRWLWGNMDTQTFHHLFPSMPRYYYYGLMPRIRQWCKDNGVEYKSEPVLDLLVRNYRTLKTFAQEREAALKVE